MRAVFLFAAIAVVQGAGQSQTASLKPPFGPVNQLISLDGAYALFGEDNALWLEDKRTQERRKVLDATVQTLTLAWSPDSAAFVVNDRAFSDVENAYIYDVKTLRPLDITSRVTVAVGAGATRFLKPQNQHSYFHAIRWLDARHVEAQLHGHTVGIWRGTYVQSGDCFDLRFRVSTVGHVQKLSQQVAPLTSKACDTTDQ